MQARKRERGFTLIEIMVVVVIIGILAAVVVPTIMSRPEQAKVTAAQHDITKFVGALNLYRLDNGHYPTTDQGLEALVRKPTSNPLPRAWNEDGYLEKIPLDPWNNPYQYLSPGTRGKIDVWSLGPDGEPSDDDIGNW